MSSSQSDPQAEKHAAVREARTKEVAKEVEAYLWSQATSCIFQKGLGGVFDLAFKVDRKALVVNALKNIIKKLEDGDDRTY